MTIKFSPLCFLVLLAACKEEHDHSEHDDKAETPAANAKSDSDDHKEDATKGLIRIDPEMMRDLRVTTSPAEARAAGEGVMVLGELRVNQDAYAEVGAPMQARVAKVLVAAGDVVKAGQGLVEVQSPELGRARAEYLSAKSRLVLATQARDRKRQLLTDKVVAEREVQEAEAEATAAEAAVRAARSTLKASGISFDEDAAAGDGEAALVLRSPVAGTVIDRDVARGAVVNADKTLFRIADLSRLWLVVHAFERDAVRVRVGAEARVTFPSLPGKTFGGKVTWVGAEVDAASRTIPVRVEVENKDGVLKPGMSGAAWVPLGDAGDEVVTVPAMAMQRIDKGWAVFVPREAGVFEPRAVGRGRDLGGEIEVLNGLKAGEQVVVDGAFLLKAEIEKQQGGGEEHEH